MQLKDNLEIAESLHLHHRQGDLNMTEFYPIFMNVQIVSFGIFGVSCCVVGFICDMKRSGDEDRIGGPR